MDHIGAPALRIITVCTAVHRMFYVEQSLFEVEQFRAVVDLLVICPHMPRAKALLTFILFTTCAFAQVSPKLYSGIRWRMIGPFRAGRALTVAGISGNRDVYYFG